MTYLEEIKLTLANNECSIAENAYKKEEAERNLAKKIKELLDKNISKEDIANVIKLPIEDLNSLLEKYYQKTPEKDLDSDIQSQLNFLKQQVQILQKKLDNQEFENVQLKQQLNTLQALQENRINTVAERIETTQGIQQWEYKNGSWREEELNKLGEEGWEVVGLSEYRTVLKRPKKCIYCNGTGIRNWIDIYDNKVKKKCDKCNGTGKILL